MSRLNVVKFDIEAIDFRAEKDMEFLSCNRII